MSLPSNEVVLLQKHKATPILLFTFQGELSKHTAHTLIHKWNNFHKQYRTRRFILIWDATGMTGYDPAARSQWQRMMKEVRDKIDKIYLVSDKRVIRLGANLMSMFSKLTIKPVMSLPEITELETQHTLAS
ncbi:MAG TPA: hypothetical protein DCE41_26585 [Cytophagales bacterium]|nr:hypothetical protein [Cytophagales bacterium]HAA22532.1 hypothetical protein [Cytophagales bacterium]HAP61402.1 hypothetical protein [Cytophagales bacterium]